MDGAAGGRSGPHEKRRCVQSAKVWCGESDATMVTGEPMHELINLRRVLPSVGHDFADIYFDHAEAGLGILLTFQCSMCFGHEIGAADTGKMCYGFSFC